MPGHKLIARIASESESSWSSGPVTFFTAELHDNWRIRRAESKLCIFAREHSVCTRRAKMESPLLTRNIAGYGGREAADRLESIVKKRHVISYVMK